MLNLRKKILVAIDGSPQSDKAAEEAVRMAASNRSQFKSCIYAMLVLPNAPTPTYTDFVPSAPGYRNRKVGGVRGRIFYVIEKYASEYDIPLEIIIEYGEPVDNLLEFAKKEQIDVIVIRKLSALRVAFSVAAVRVITRHASHMGWLPAQICSVYIVRG